MDHTDEIRTNGLTVTWPDPELFREPRMEKSGLDFLRACLNEQLPPPPMLCFMGIRMDAVEHGRAVFSVEPGEEHYNAAGVVHGGLLATLCDTALAGCIHSVLPRGMANTTIELHVNYVRAATRATGRLRCEAEIVHRGGKIATARAKVLDGEDRLYAHASTTCLLFRQ